MTKSPIKLPPPVFNDEKHHLRLYQGDCLELLPLLPESSVDLLFADPPYFLSNNGITCHAGKMVSVNKGEWDKSRGPDANHEFNRSWLKEPILQSAIRQHLTIEANLDRLCKELQLSGHAVDLEVLGEKALPEGHVDILLKQRTPIGSAMKIPIEVKTNEAKEKDLEQVLGYMKELRGECPAAILLAAAFSKRVVSLANDSGIQLVRYILDADLSKTPTFEEICQGLTLERVSS